jgi:hypothetical protein
LWNLDLTIIIIMGHEWQTVYEDVSGRGGGVRKGY